MGYSDDMRIELILEDGSEVAVTIEEDGATFIHDKTVELIRLTEQANEAAVGPPLWAGPLEAVRRWVAERPGVRATEVDVPPLPSVEGRVY